MAIVITRVEQPGGAVELRIAGHTSVKSPLQLDLLEAGELEDRLKAEMSSGVRKLVIDMSNVAYVHSRGFWAIVRAGEELLARAGQMVILNPLPRMSHLLEVTSASRSVVVSMTAGRRGNSAVS